MKLAWLRADTPRPTHPLDDTAALIAELRSAHDIKVFTPANAHALAWKDLRGQYDLSVYELGNTPAYAFIWPYLLHHSGVLLLRTLILHDSRAAVLVREQRMQDYIAEFDFNHGPSSGQPTTTAPHPYHGHWPMLRVPLLASRVAVVSHPSTAATLQQTHPTARVRYASTGVARGETNLAWGADPSGPPGEPPPLASTRFGLMSSNRMEIMQRAMKRATDAGASADLLMDPSPERILQGADVIVSLPWPWFDEPSTPALAAMAAGKTVIVLETAATADWPALDPQTWRPRGLNADAPIAVSIDPRDEEHSLVLAIRRLSTDAALRARLGDAAHNWWQTHATPRHAAEDWIRILAEAARLHPPPRPTDWPVHL